MKIWCIDKKGKLAERDIHKLLMVKLLGSVGVGLEEVERFILIQPFFVL